MRCLVVADRRSSIAAVRLAAGRPRLQFDLVIFAGDALDVGSFVDFRAQIVVVDEIPGAAVRASRRSFSARAITTSTNAATQGEKDRALGRRDQTELGIACDGDTLTIGDTLFTVCPWWDGPLRQRDVSAISSARLLPRSGKGRWIWVHHAPPANSPTSWGGNRFIGDVELRAMDRAAIKPSMS